MRFSMPAMTGSNDPLSEIVARLWQMKVRSIRLLEDWLPQVSDFGIRAGLQAHLAEERRHQRLLAAEIAKRDGRKTATAPDSVLERPFAIVRDQSSDTARVKVFHHGIKASTALYCGRIMPLVDAGLARVLEQVARDEERHIRWADIRLSQEKPASGIRNLDPVLQEAAAAMEAVWSRPWQRLSQANHRLGRAG